MSKGHVHAALMALYAEDAAENEKPWELWEVGIFGGWSPLKEHPTWNPSGEYRRKTRIININGYEVPEPLRRPPAEGERLWKADPLHIDYAYYTSWSGTAAEMRLLKRGLLHTTKIAAETHSLALISFTKGE